MTDPVTQVAAGGVVVREMGGVPRVLLILDPYGSWSLPKGHLEGEETREEAAVREVREETGLDQVELGPEVDTVSWTFEAEGRTVRKVCTFYLMRSRRGTIRPEASAGIEACAWLTFDRAGERVDYDAAREVIREAREMLES